MAAFHLGQLLPGLWYCAHSLGMEPLLTSLVTLVLFLQSVCCEKDVLAAGMSTWAAHELNVYSRKQGERGEQGAPGGDSSLGPLAARGQSLCRWNALSIIWANRHPQWSLTNRDLQWAFCTHIKSLRALTWGEKKDVLVIFCSINVFAEGAAPAFFVELTFLTKHGEQFHSSL